MMKSLRLSSALALFAALLFTAPAVAQDDPAGAGPVEECLMQMGETAGNAINGIKGLTAKGVNAIKELDENGAPDRAIAHAGARAKRAINRVSERASRVINLTADRCLLILRELGAPPEAGMAIQNGRREALGAVGQADHRGKQIIRHAVREAIAPDEGEGEAPADAGSEA